MGEVWKRHGVGTKAVLEDCQHVRQGKWVVPLELGTLLCLDEEIVRQWKEHFG